MALGPDAGALAVICAAFVIVRPASRNGPARSVPAPLLVGYGVLIVALAAGRAVPPITHAFQQWGSVQPFGGAPAFQPLLHPGAWLIGVLLITGVLSRRAGQLSDALHGALARGWQPTLATMAFVATSQVLSAAWVIQEGSDQVGRGLGALSVLLLPMSSAAVGFLTGSSNATNAPLIPAGSGVAGSHGISSFWIAATQSTTCSMLAAFAPWRVVLACSAAGLEGGGREVGRAYRTLAGMVVLTMVVCAAVVVVLSN